MFVRKLAQPAPCRRCVVPKCTHGRTVRQLNNLFYKCNDITGQELRELTQSRRLQFSQTSEDIRLIVYKETWNKPDDDDIWDGMAEIINALSVGDRIRMQLDNKKALEEEATIELISSAEEQYS